MELPALLGAGCSRSALRWLAAKGYVIHAVEKRRPRSAQRSFHQTANLSFVATTCFVLTPNGLAIARSLEQEPDQARQESAPGNEPLLPCWAPDSANCGWGVW